MIKDVEGIVLSFTNYGESSKILNVITKEYGVIGIMSKGCRKLKSNLRSYSDKLTYGVFHIHYKADKLSTLISVDIIDELRNIKSDITNISYASFLSELTNQVFKQSTSFDIFDIFKNAVLKINDGLDPKIITNIIELKYLVYLGVKPILDGCAVCGSVNNIITISSESGGYICDKCVTYEKIVSIKTIKLIRMLYHVDIKKISKLDIDNNCKQEINDFIDQYYDKYTGLYLKSKSFLKNLNRVVV